MTKFFLVLIAIIYSASLVAGGKNTVEILQISQQAIYKSKLECQNKLSSGSFQDCGLKLFRAGKIVENMDIFINGSMPGHSHGLPTSPKIIWSEEKKVYLIQGLKFSMPGEWTLDFKLNHHDDKLKDQILMPIEVID